MLHTLRVLARGNVLVLDTDFARQTGAKRYIGRKTVSAWNIDDLPADEPGHIQRNEFLQRGDQPIPHTAHPKSSEPASIDLRSSHPETVRFILKTIKSGGLWPADKETAQYCGVPFDPSFGGEYPELTSNQPSK